MGRLLVGVDEDIVLSKGDPWRYLTAIGFTGDPMPATTRSGAAVSRTESLHQDTVVPYQNSIVVPNLNIRPTSIDVGRSQFAP